MALGQWRTQVENPFADQITDIRPSEVTAPDARDVIGAAFRQENLIGALVSRQWGGGEPERDYNPWNDIAGTAYEEHWSRFAGSMNSGNTAALKRQIDMELDDRRTLAASGGWGLVATLGAGIFSPENLLPGGAIVRGVSTASTVARTALSTASAAAIAAGAAEVGLQGLQETRTLEESAIAIGGSAIIGGALGGALARMFSPSDFTTYARQVDAEMRAPDNDALARNEAAMRDFVSGQSVGAAARPVMDIDDLGVGGRAAQFAAAPVARLNPALRIATSPSQAVREVGAGLLENGFYLKANMEGRTQGPGVESLIKEFTLGRVATATENLNRQFNAFRKAGGQMDRAMFNEAVGRAMRRGDTGIAPGAREGEFAGLDIDPHITAAAQAWRKEVFDPLKKEAIDAGLLPSDVSVDTALTYFTRLYNTPKLIAGEGRFKQIVRGWMDGQIRSIEEDAARKANLEAEGKEPPDFLSPSDREAYIDDIADQVWRTLTGKMDDGEVPMNVLMKSKNRRGPLEERTFNIPDELIEEFLESDVEKVGRYYSRVMSADVELTKRFGSANLEDTISNIRQDFGKLRQAVNADENLTAAQKEKSLRALDSREKADVRDVEAIRDLVRGTYKRGENASNFARVARVAGTLNYLRALGGVTVSSLPDLGRVLMVHGMTGLVKDGLVPLISNLKAVKMSVKEARMAGAVTERILNTRMATWAELTDPYSFNSPFERFMDNTAAGFSKLNMLTYWNDFQKSFASIVTQNRVLRNVGGMSGLGKREKAYMAYLGIDEGMAERIARQFDRHGSIETGGVRVAGTERWDDEWARRVYRAAINKDIDTTIVTKGIADVPLFMNTPMGRLVGQFKSFALASHQRMLMRGLAERPAGFVSGTMVAATIGMMVYAFKSLEANRGEDISDNPGRWVAEGLDRSGIFALAFEVNNTVEKSLGIGAYAAIQSLFPDREQGGLASRYLMRSTLSSYLGPTADFIDTAERAFRAVKDQATGEGLTEGDVNAIRRLAPFATLPGVRSLVEYMGVPAVVDAID